MMNLSRKTAVVGVYEHPTRFAPDKTMYQIMAESISGALDDAGLTIKDVDGISAAGIGMGAMGIVGLLRLPQPDAQFRRWNQHRRLVVRRAYDARRSRDCCRPVRGRGSCIRLADVLRALRHRHRRRWWGRRSLRAVRGPFGVTTVGSYAMIAQRHMYEYGTKPEQLAEIAVTMRHHASMNPVAKYRDPITVEDVLASRMISSPLHLLDCCIIRDGGGALVITSAERARDLKKKPVYILGAGGDRASRRRGASRLSRKRRGATGRLAFERAGVAHSRHRHGDDLRLVHHHRDFDARESRLLQTRRGRRIRVGRAHRASTANFPSTPTAAGFRRIIPGCAEYSWSSRRPSSCAANAVRARSRIARSRSRTAPAARSVRVMRARRSF